MLCGNDIKKIEKLSQKGNTDKILSFLNSKTKETRIAAIKALNPDKSSEAYNKLISMLHCTDIDERTAVIDALGRSNNSAAITHINHNMETETNEKVLDAMNKAITNIKKSIAHRN